MEEMIPKEESGEEKKVSFKNKLILLALFGALLGFVIKTEASKRVTVGFEDYKIGDPQETYDISRMEKELLKKKALLDKQRLEEERKSAEDAQKGEEDSAGASCQEGAAETCKL